jgi:hypothetical protein
MSDETKPPQGDPTPQSGQDNNQAQNNPSGPSSGQKQMFRKRRRFFSPTGKKLGAGPFPGSGSRSFSGPSGPMGARPNQPTGAPPMVIDGPDDAPHVEQERIASQSTGQNEQGARRWQPRNQQQNAGGQNRPQNNRRFQKFQNNNQRNNQNNNQNQRNRQQNNQSRGQSNQGGQPRNFSQQNTHQPGNQQSGYRQNNFRPRQGRQRQQPTFVGPMDHSYRSGNEANGNFDPNFNMQRTPANLMPRDSSGEVNFNIAAPQPVMTAPSVPMMENTVPRIYCFVDDLFFVAKIQETAKKLGLKVLFTDDQDEVIARFKDTIPEDMRPTLAIFDLNHATLKPLSVIAKLKKKVGKEISILGFLNHLQGELKMEAQEAGCDAVMPRSAFSTNLPQILRKHGLPEEMEQQGA